MSMEDKESPAAAAQPEPETEASGANERDLDFYIKTIEDLRKERDEFYDLLLRKQAEFENYRKRTAREREESQIAARGDVLKEILEVVDACEKGLEALTTGEGETMDAFVDGYRLLFKSLQGVLDRFEVEPVPGPGAIFDPTVHEAVIRDVDEERRDGEILEEFRKGYTLKGRLLRPSQVKVSVRPEGEPSGT